MERLFEKSNEKVEISLQEKCDYENDKQGSLPYYNCPICLNRGYVNVIINDTIMAKNCTCLSIRKIKKNLLNSGINQETFEKYCFETFEAKEEWQIKIKNKFFDYLKEIQKGNKYWLYIGGISGLGKTHLCTSVAKELIRLGYNFKYMLWKDEIIKLKQLKKSSFTDNIELYEIKMNELKNIDILYIDDLFKLIDKFSKEEDLNIAYEIINSRYINNKITIISCEYEKQQIKDFDMAIFGRIYEKCGKEENYFVYSKYDETRNYRLKKGE